MITKKWRAKDGKITNKEGIKDGNIIESIDKITMANLIEIGITEILIIEIVEIDKEEI
jgi:hypothetical protein